MAFLSWKQIHAMGFKSFGSGVQISDKASIYNAHNISVGDNSRIDDFVILSAGEGGIEIGRYVHIACYAAIIGKGKVTLKDFVGVSSRVNIYSSNDDYSGEFMTGPCVPKEYTNVIHADVTLEKHVVVGAHSIILPGITIGEGSSIGAMSLVNRNVGPYEIVAGVPASFRKKRQNGIFQLEKLIN
jgi:acetyltransferase-like isoleucine patch superfamily enzyme